MPPHTSPLRARLVALVVGTIAALGLAEITLRIARPARVSVIRYPCIYQPDPQLGYRYTPGATGRVAGHFEIENAVQINSIGFYDEEPLPPKRSKFRVLAIGDSFTAAMNVPRDAVWTAVLERELRARGYPTADVVNLGLDGTGTDVHVELIRQYLPRFEPDVVVLAFFANDFQDTLNGRFERECYRGYVLSYQTPKQRGLLRERVDTHQAKRLQRFVVAHSYLARLVHRAVADPLDPHHIEFLQPRASELGITEALRDSRRPRLARALGRLEQLARSCHCRLVVAPVPPRGSPEASVRRFRRAVRALDIEVVDVVPGMRRMSERDGVKLDDLYFVHDAHLNVQGNALYARALADLLAPGRPAH